MYVICGKNINAGVCGNDSGDLNSYFELGWEIMVTRLKAIKLLCSNKITTGDTIVTFPDRRFLYTSIFENVITYAEYLNRCASNIEKNMKFKVVDLVHTAQTIVKSKELYNFSEEELKVVKNVDYCDVSHYNTSDKFICLLIRRRDWCAERNGDENYYIELLEQFDKLNIPVYLGGLGTEKYAVHKNTKHVTLQEWATLMHHENCMALLGSTSGSSTLLGQLCCTNKILVNDPAGVVKQRQVIYKHPLFAGKCVHFTDVPLKFYTSNPKIDQIFDDIKNWTWKP